MHIITTDQEEQQNVVFPVRGSTGSYLYALVQVEESGDSYQYVLSVSATASYRTLRIQFPYASEGMFFYLRVFKPTEPLTETMATLAGVETPTPITRRNALNRLDSYFSENDLTEEVYRGKIFCTDASNLEKYSMYGQDPFTTTTEDNTAKWKTY